MSALLEKRLARLRALRTELRSLGLEGAAEEVGEEISTLQTVPTDNPAVAEFLGAVLDLEKGLTKSMNEIEREEADASTLFTQFRRVGFLRTSPLRSSKKFALSMVSRHNCQ